MPPPDKEDEVKADQLAAFILGSNGPSGDPNANPKGGFSYLDNLASVLKGDVGNMNAYVLLDQLLGSERTGAHQLHNFKGDYKDKEPSRLGTQVYPYGPMPAPMASDIPGDRIRQDLGVLGPFDIETDPNQVGDAGKAGAQMRYQLRQMLQEHPSRQRRS